MTENLKYPRTPHLHSSPGATSDDKWMSSEGISFLKSGIELVVTEKMDGSNFTMTNSGCFGRSVDARTNHWDNYPKQVWSSIAHLIPAGWRLSGENMYARKSVSYDDLPGVFLLFGVWNEEDSLLSWDDTLEWGELLDLPVVESLYRGSSFDEGMNAWSQLKDEESSEGFVMRSSALIPFESFSGRVAKWVRADHVRTNDDWRRRDDYELNTFRESV